MENGSRITMTGEGEQNANRNWYAFKCNGALSVDLAGEISVNNARGIGIYATGQITFSKITGSILMMNPNGDNRNLYAIYSNSDIVFNNGLAGRIELDFGNGNSGYAIASGNNVIVNGVISGSIETIMGISHAGLGIYAKNSVTVTGDISGSIYARGGSGSGYGIYAVNGDIAIAKISGSVTGDCYNQIMNNSQSGGSAIYANNGSVYGSKDGDTVNPLQLTGTLSSTVGRNDAYTVMAKQDVSINIAGNGEIKAQSSYSADYKDLKPNNGTQYKDISNNWGGAAAGVVAGGEVSITGNADSISVTSESALSNEIDAAFLAKTGKLSSVNHITKFLYQVAEGETEDIKDANSALTSEEKALINGYDEIIADALAVTVNNLQALKDALNNGDP